MRRIEKKIVSNSQNSEIGLGDRLKGEATENRKLIFVQSPTYKPYKGKINMADYSIYPSIGVARLGNSDDGFFLAPDAIGGLPKDYDPSNDGLTTFSGFRDSEQKIRRQAQKFRIYDDSDQEIIVGSSVNNGTVSGVVTNIEWTVHLANKKSEWYNFSEQKGNLLYGSANSYEVQGVEKRNFNTIQPDEDNELDEPLVPSTDRQTFFIDPGPRTIDLATVGSVPIDRNYPGGYTGHFPPTAGEITNGSLQGNPINTLGELRIDSSGRLLVLGGKGYSQGQIPLDSYGGADTWYDDVSDGSVTCTIHVDGNSFEVTGKAWVIVGPPDFAPELVNIASWDDTIFDVAVRKRNLLGIYDEVAHEDTSNPSLSGFDKSFPVNYQRDILPIIKRIAGYQWVANVQSMSAFFSDFNDLDPENTASTGEFLTKRQEFFNYFRPPIPQEEKTGSAPPYAPTTGSYPSVQTDLFEGTDNIPLMPLNSGSNSVKNYNIKKFMALTRTQYFFLRQWAFGVCNNDSTNIYDFAEPKNRASVGNVVGLPQCPGIEVTWTTQNEIIYEDGADIYRIKHRDGYDYFANGLTPGRDECDPTGANYGTGGCEPGDLTKRMAIPWQADFFNCTIQHVNFRDQDTNKYDPGNPDSNSWTDDNENLTPLPPTYYAYWWPPQAPWDVLVGTHADKAAQEAAGDLSSGLQVNFMRGINSYGQMVNNGWSYLGFIRNQNANASGYYPYFVETERDHEHFEFKDVGIGDIIGAFGVLGRDDDNETSVKVFYVVDQDAQKEIKASRRRALNLDVVEDLFQEIKIAASHRRRTPRSGNKVRF